MFCVLKCSHLDVFLCHHQRNEWVLLFHGVDWLKEAVWWCHFGLGVFVVNSFFDIYWIKQINKKNTWQINCLLEYKCQARLSARTNREMTVLYWFNSFTGVWPQDAHFWGKRGRAKTSIYIRYVFTVTFDTLRPFSPAFPSGGRGTRPQGWLNIKDTGPLQQSYWEQIYEVAKRWPREKYSQLNHTTLLQCQIISLCKAYKTIRFSLEPAQISAQREINK